MYPAAGSLLDAGGLGACIGVEIITDDDSETWRQSAPSLVDSDSPSANGPGAVARHDVVVFDCQRMGAQALTTALSARFDCAEATASLEALVATVAEVKPRMIVFSLGACGLGLLAGIQGALGASIFTQAIVVCEPDNRALTAATLAADVAGLVFASSDLVELQLAIELLRSGKRYHSPAVVASLADGPRRPLAALTRCQRNVMRMRQEGMSLRQIARALGQGVKNIEKRLRAGKRKFGAGPGEEVDFSRLDLG